MPTVLRQGPYRVYFYSNERDEPPHVHVDREDKTAKFWLQPLSLQPRPAFDLTSSPGSGGGRGIHWPELDEDLSTAGLLRGSPAPSSGRPGR